MAKSKNLFTAADFTKDGGKKKSKIWIVIAAIVVIAVVAVAVIILTKKDKSTESTISEPAPVEQVVTTPAESTQPAEDAATTTAQEAPKTEEVKVQPIQAQPETVKTAQTSAPVQYTGDTSILNGKTLNEKANIVIRGTFGNNPDRKRVLGDAYQEIQDRVNEMYRNGEVR